LKKYLKIIGFAAAGSLLGYGYYYFIGCSAGGTCPLTSRWYITTLYGLAVGIIAAFPVNTKNKKEK
jgi:hypothetical protein